ncbi:MAG: histidine kinase [Nocardioides sp.]|nr:histidine kinase [Nocardioides sp.]
MVPALVRRRLTAWFAPAMTVEDRMFRWLAVVRLLVLANAVALVVYRFDNVQKPVAAVACTVVMVVWTGVSTWAYVEPSRRQSLLLLADLAVAVALVALSPVVKGAGFSATIPGFWVIGALLAWAVHWRWVGGLVAGLVLSAVDLSVRQDIAQNNYANAFLLVLGGTIIGFLVESLQLMATERDRAQRSAAAAAERARLARAVHDGVLQVLALVQRRGAELGGEAAELARLAGEQEGALRMLIRAQDSVVASPNEAMVDLAAAVSALGTRPGVHVATPGSPVEVPRATADELLAAVGACLDNVARHVGEGAPSWVLLEAFPDRVEVAVRDEGPGIPEGRLLGAEAEGRLGVVESIRGRLEELAGTATLHTGPDGTEWELVVPREPTRPDGFRT